MIPYLLRGGEAVLDGVAEQVACIQCIAITGTHSAGKSTLMNDFMQALDPLEGQLYPWLREATFTLASGITIPIVGVTEAATDYAHTIAKDPSVMTHNYRMEHQIGVESIAFNRLLYGGQRCAELAASYQSSNRRLIGLLISDRTPLDGHVYSRLRLPAEEQVYIDMEHVAQFTGGRPPKTVHDSPIPYRWRIRRSVREMVDIALLPDHTEVAFEHTDVRIEGEAFRDTVANAINAYYSRLLTADQVQVVHGSREERLTAVATHALQLISQHIAA